MAASSQLAEAAATGSLNDTDVVNLLVGHPSARLFPRATLAQFYEKTLLSPPELHERDRHILTYGPDAGQYTVRRSLSNYLRAVYDIQADWTEADAENLIITGGASSTFGEILKRCTDTTTNVIVVEPTYFLVGGILEDAGFSLEGNSSGTQKVYGVPWLSADDDLASSVRNLITSTPSAPSSAPVAPRYQQKATSRLIPSAYPTGPQPRRLYDWVIYLTPTYSNPTGLTLPTSRREALVKLAREFNCLVVTDDVYDLLPYCVVAEGEFPPIPPLRLVDIDRLTPGTTPGGNTLSNGSFSKVLGPGLRVGWLEGANPELVQQICQSGVIKSGGAMGHFNSCVIRQMLMKRAVDIPVLSQLMMTYKFRAGVLIRSVGRNLPVGTTILGGDGGYFLYVGIGTESDNVNAGEVTKLAKEEGVIVLPGDACMLGGKGGGRWVRLAVCYEEDEAIVKGVERLGRAVRKYYEQKGLEWKLDEEKAKVEEPKIEAVAYETLVPPVEKTNRRKRAQAKKKEEEKAAAAAAAAAAASGEIKEEKDEESKEEVVEEKGDESKDEAVEEKKE